VTDFEATVRSVDGRDVTLETTYFYAEGGGQPADRGAIDGHDVVDVQTENGVTVHTLDAAPDFEAGELVTGDVDETFRTYSMRAHTASHVVYGAGRKLFGTHGYGGFDIGEERVRLDFVSEADAADVSALDVQRLANEAVWDDRDVEWYEMELSAAREKDNIVFNLGDDAETSQTVRIVEVDGWDISACGGTHVERTSEIGPITVFDVSNPGANLVRVEYAVGPTAIQWQVEETRAATRAAETLDTGIRNLPERVETIVAENTALREEMGELRARLLDARLAELGTDPVDRNGEEWVVGTVENLGPNTVADRLRDHELTVDVAVLVGRDGSTFVVVGTDGDADANTVVETVTDEFGGGGGGQPTLAQGGGLDADPQAVVDYLRET